MQIEEYFNSLKQWMAYYGFEEIKVHAEAGTDLVFKKSEVKASKFGKVDEYCCIKYFKEINAEEFCAYSTKMFDLSMKHRSGTALGFGAMLQVFPLIITGQISNDVYQKVMNYCPKHFAAAEFPSVLDLSTGYLYYYNETPMWGYAYYDGYRRDSYRYFSPKAWQKAAEGTIKN